MPSTPVRDKFSLIRKGTTTPVVCCLTPPRPFCRYVYQRCTNYGSIITHHRSPPYRCKVILTVYTEHTYLQSLTPTQRQIPSIDLTFVLKITRNSKPGLIKNRPSHRYGRADFGTLLSLVVDGRPIVVYQRKKTLHVWVTSPTHIFIGAISKILRYLYNPRVARDA